MTGPIGGIPSRLKIIVCGGGIAGFATALLLREEHDVVVLEGSELNLELGAAITLSMNATRLLRSSLRRAGFDEHKARFVEAETFQELHWKDLSVIMEMNIGDATRKYGEPWWYFSRHDIHAELKRAALSSDGLGNTPILHLGNKVVDVDPKSGSVTCSNGQIYTGDVIIAADGIHSAAGRSVFGKLPVVGDGFSAYRCMIPTSKMRNNPETAILVDAAKVLIIIGPDRRIVAYPCSSWETMNFVCIFPSDKKLEHQWNTEVSVQEMVDIFKDFHPSVGTFLSMASNTGVWPLLDREPLSTLVEGSFAMIGDAAHAMGPHQGQGACQAIEDAEALRIVLKGATPDQVEERLKIYDELRLKRVNQVIRHTRDMAPKRHQSQEVNHRTTQTYADYHWSYKMTQEAVALMNKHGYPMALADVETADVRIPGNSS